MIVTYSLIEFTLCQVQIVNYEQAIISQVRTGRCKTNHLLVTMMLTLWTNIIIIINITQYSKARQCLSNSSLCSCAALRRGSGTASVGTVVRTPSHLLLSWLSPVSPDQSTMNLCAFKHRYIEQGLTSHQTHYRSIGDGFSRVNDTTNSVKALKEDRS